MSDLLISVILPTHNRASKLERVLVSLLQDEYPHKEIIVYDGASTDGTVELLKSYGSRIHWISEPDKGEYDARNKCLRLARGELIKYMSDDDELLPGSFTFAAQYFEDHPEVDILFGQSVWFDERGGREPTVIDTRKRTNESITLRNFIRTSAPLANSETVFFRRSVIDRIGFFDESLIGADYDYWARAATNGIRIAICDRVMIHYHLSDQSGVERKQRELLIERWRLAWKYGDWTDRLYAGLILIPSRLVILIILKVFPFIGIPLREAWNRLKARQEL